MTTGASIAESSLKPKSFTGVDFTNSPLTEQLRQSAHEAIDGIAVSVARTENELREKAVSLGKSLEKGEIPNLKEVLNTDELATNNLQTELEGYLTKTQHFIRNHPILSLGIAFGAGFVLPRLLKDS